MIEIPFTVLAHEHGLRLDVFIGRRMKRMSRNLAAQLIASGLLRREGEGSVTKAARRVREGESFFLQRKQLHEASPDDIDIPVIYQDAKLVAVNKPGNVVVHPTASAYRRSLIRIVRERLGDPGLDLAHRLDKETSGVLLLGRDVSTSTHLKEQFAGRHMQKTYLALVVGCPEQDQFVVDAPMFLVPQSESGVLMAIGGDSSMAALTEFTVLLRGHRVALVAAQPKTGRQHQIRLHLHHAGFPILGDKLYLGGEDFFIRSLRDQLDAETIAAEVGHPRQALHAWQLELRHPETGERLHLIAEPPDDLIVLAQRFGMDIKSVHSK